MPDSESPQPTGPASIARDMPDRVSPAEISRLRWKWGMGIVTAGGVSEALVWNQIAPDATYQVLWSIPVLSATACALLVWWFFFQRHRPGNAVSWTFRADFSDWYFHAHVPFRRI